MIRLISMWFLLTSYVVHLWWIWWSDWSQFGFLSHFICCVVLPSLSRLCGQRVPSLDVQMSTSTWDTFHLFNFGFLNLFWIPNCSPGCVPTVVPLLEPCCLQLCHWRQSYWRIHVFRGFPIIFDKVLTNFISFWYQQGTACSSCPSSTTCVDSLCQAAWVFTICQATWAFWQFCQATWVFWQFCQAAWVFFWQEDCFWSSFAGFEVKVKFSFCCRYFQFFQQKLAYVTLTLCNLMTFIHRAAAGSWQCFITSYLDIETAPALPLNKLQTTVLGQVFKISQASDLNLIHWVQKKFSHQKRFQMM